jgi:Flp pilus assembly protein TadD
MAARAAHDMARLSRLLLFCLLIPASLAAQASTPADAERLFIRGVEMQRAGDVIGAIDAYKTALAMDPTRVDALSNLGAAYVHLGSSRTRSRATTRRCRSTRTTPPCV